ncbi:MAG: nucleoside phosphorylase [Desulfotignum sp.]|nr:nucleoside phosphorylase [Desulfotignum sp.]MCF8137209.1 nucleoside phosphorylase [Desulfotignum sp.]
MNCPTWLDLSEDSLVPPLGTRQAPSLGPVAVMVSTAADLKRIQPVLDAEDCPSVPFFVSRLITDSRGFCVAGPFVGSPYAVMMMESLVAKGARQILVLGWCGSLRADLQVGDLIVPDLGLVDEGTSRHYVPLDPVTPQIFPGPDLTRKLSDCLEARGLTCVQGPVWTTDAIYRETPKKVAWFREQGALAVEMECSALFSLAAFRNVEVAALLVVSDSLAAGNWDPGFGRSRFKAARQEACEAILAVARDLANAAILEGQG